jgi:septal ring factor EnvC (AmiA/AmiB activator)
MTISLELIIGIITLISMAGGFMLTRIKDAEKRGRLMQRIDELEKTLSEMRFHHRSTDEKIGLHDTEIMKICTEIKELRSITERIDKKLDKALENRIYPGD